ncbi:MAG TPA: cytochrome c biogenesis protein CcsA [Thermoanaerobaculia bacterium]|nr:cytochrome c biogenesis protein CcsA [Thermoanaerobaculia bacterium]
MDTFLDAANVLLPVGYLLAAVAYGSLFFGGSPRARRLATPILVTTVALHLADLVVLTLRWRQFPFVTVSEVLSVVAFAVAAVYLLLEWHGRERSTGLWLVGLVFLFQLLSALLHVPVPPQREVFHDPLFASHVSLAMVGYAAFVIAAAYGFLFLELYRELKGGRFSTFYGRLPPLEVLERMMTGALSVGFVAFTAAVGLGVFWAEQRYPEWQWLRDPNILLTLGTWTLYAVALLLRRTRRWHGRQTAVAALAGLGVIVVSLVAVRLLSADFHGLL